MIDTINVGAKYLIALVVVAGCFYIIATSRSIIAGAPPDNTQPWSVITLVVGWLIRDSAGNSAAANVATIAAAQPTVTTSGQPPTTTIAPAGPAA